MSDSETDPAEVLVAGAGPTGLAAALELTRRGHRVRIIEKNVERSRFSKALGITAGTLQRLEPCGAGARLLDEGRKVHDARFFRGAQPIGRVRFAELAEPWNFLLVLPQSRTEHLLEKQLGALGVEVERGHELAGFEQDERGVRSRLRYIDGSESHVESDYLLGADGAHSRVRKNLDLDFAGHTVAGDWSLADIHATLPGGDGEHDGPAIRISDHRMMFMLRIHDDVYRIASNLPDALDHLPEGSEVRGVIWQSNFTVNHRLVESHRVGRVFLAGDAAHIHSPLGGRGMNLGIEDAVDFARLLDSGRLDEYHALRHAKGRSIVRLVSTMTRLMASPAFGPRIFRRWVLPLVLRLRFVTRGLARRMVDP